MSMCIEGMSERFNPKEKMVVDGQVMEMVSAFFRDIFSFDGNPIEAELTLEWIQEIATVSPEGLKVGEYMMETDLFNLDDEGRLTFHTGEYSLGSDFSSEEWRILDLGYLKGIMLSTQDQRLKVLSEAMERSMHR